MSINSLTIQTYLNILPKNDFEEIVMKKLIAVLCFGSMHSMYAADLCARYENNVRYSKGIDVLAQFQNYSREEFCQLPRVLDLEIQPSRIITREGEVIPHLRIQQHFAESSCLYMISEIDWSISEKRCYSGF